MHMAARKATVIIATRSDASILNQLSAGIHYEVQVCIDRCDDTGMQTISIAQNGMHLPVRDIDIAERLGVLAAMNMMLQKIENIRKTILEVARRTQPCSILLYTDRQCLETTLPKCKAFRCLRRKIKDAYGLKPRTPVDVRWESRDRAYMQVVDQFARGEWNRVVIPIYSVFDESFIQIINMSDGWPEELLKMHREYLRKTGWSFLVYKLWRRSHDEMKRNCDVVKAAVLLYKAAHVTVRCRRRSQARAMC